MSSRQISKKNIVSNIMKEHMNIVSGFISNVNKRADRDVTKYLNFGLELMAVEIPMIIFIERTIFESHILKSFNLNQQTYEGEFIYRISGGIMDGIQKKYSYLKIGHITFVFFNMCDLFLWESRNMAHKFKLNTGNPNKDTLEYMMVQCQKSEWMAIATQLNEHNNHESRGCNKSHNDISEFIWIDFGSFHMFQGKIDVFQTELYKMRSRVNKRLLNQPKNACNKITFARCWDPTHVYYGDIYRDVNWLFAGSIFGGSISAIHIFALKMREKCLQVLREKNTLMWEINIWVLIFRESEELFSMYPSDHSEIIFRGY